MAKTYVQPDPAVVLAITAAAMAAGTHSTRCDHVCSRCREWAVMYHGQFDGSAICLKCAAAIGVAGAKDHLLAKERAARIAAQEEINRKGFTWPRK